MANKRTKKTIIKNTKKKVTGKAPSKSRKSTSTPPKYRRPPVITLMGHVDHGKTTLLDSIRKSNQVAKEHGGITQNICAYQIEHQGRKITFIDTPGHAAFAKMRSLGAQVTDIVVLVVAADDGVKPQTREALSHIRAAKVPYMVAINKIDLPGANIERVKGQLAEEKVVVESYGGKIVSVDVSAKTKKNIDQLLEMILLIADLKDLTADPDANHEAVVIETLQDKKRGILATLLVKNGSLKVGSEIKIGKQTIRIKAMTDENGKQIKKAEPSTPVEVLGFKKLPQVGQLIGKDAEPKEKLQPQKATIVAEKQALTKKESSKEAQEKDEEDEEEEKQTIKIILKVDSLGSLEAITSNLSDEAEIIGKGVGEVSESDVLLAEVTGATIYAFNTDISKSAKKLAKIEGVQVITYNIIYKLFEDLEQRILKILEPTIDEEVVGVAKVIAEFEIKKEKIAGCKVNSGEISKNSLVHLQRSEEIIADTKIKSLKRGKEDVETIKKGGECGITFKPKIDFKVKDAIISYRKIDKD